jgi:outer membrane protein OmpA-like peptidoglycan-associated protein
MTNNLYTACFAFALIGCLSLAGCAKKNTFVLLPDPNGSVGEITVATEKGTQVINRADYAVEVSSAEEPPGKSEKMDRKTIMEKFGMALAADPGLPAIFNLYFESGTDRLTTQSEKLIPNILATISERKSRDISIVGHTDRVGAEELNLRLSRGRAVSIKNLLISKGVDPKIIFLDAHGESNPLIPTEDEVAEPQNRRVDVTVR